MGHRGHIRIYHRAFVACAFVALPSIVCRTKICASSCNATGCVHCSGGVFYEGPFSQQEQNPEISGNLDQASSMPFKVISFILGLFLTPCSAYNPKPKNPNVVIFVMDDVGWADVGFRNGSGINTPFLDSLVERSIIMIMLQWSSS